MNNKYSYKVEGFSKTGKLVVYSFVFGKNFSFSHAKNILMKYDDVVNVVVSVSSRDLPNYKIIKEFN